MGRRLDAASAYRSWYEWQRNRPRTERLVMADVETQRAASEITGEAHDYTMRGNPPGKTALPPDYVPTVFEEDEAVWGRIDKEIGNGQ